MKSLLVALLLIPACSSKKEIPAHDFVTPSNAKWFSANAAHSLRDVEGDAVPHLFFDMVPEFSKNFHEVNAVIITPKDSDNAFRLDLNSGQRIFSHAYCKQTDVWKEYNGSLNRPSYNIGIVPGYLDQLGEPQKIIIFGDHHFTNQDRNYYRVRIFGAFVEQACLDGNCLGRDNWVSRLVLVGVDPEDKKFTDVEDVDGFQKLMDWEEIRAELENLNGRNGKFPYLRVKTLVKFSEAVDTFKRTALEIDPVEAKKIQSGCHALYERLWNDVGVTRPEDASSKTPEELKAKLKVIAQLKKDKKPVGFIERFKAFSVKYHEEMGTCEKFVYHGNVNGDRAKFWFLSYMGIFFRLNKEGYYFDCGRRAWQKNVLTSDGTLTHTLKNDIKDCDARDVDLAMSYLPNFIKGLSQAEDDYYTFVDYDNHPLGTHRKLYSWVKRSHKNLECTNNPNDVIQKSLPVFPEDVSWTPRESVDSDEAGKIIY